MSELGFVPKHLLVADKIRAEIVSGKLRVGDRLKPDTELAQQYEINKQTVANGMAELVKEGLISRAPRRGSLVISNTPGPGKRGNMVGVLTRSTGHMYQDMARAMSRGLVKHGLYPVWINEQLFLDASNEPDNQEILKLLERLIADHPFGLIIDADRFMPFNEIQKNLAKTGRLVFVYHYLHEERLPGAYVLVDLEKVGKLIASHLAKNGHRRLSYLTAPQEKRRPYFETPHEIICRTMQKYCNDNKLEFIAEIPERCFKGEPIEAILSDFRQRNLMPTGFGVHSDSFAVNAVMPALAKLKLRMPEDISLVGMGDTPWCQETTPPLTSISLQPQEMGEMAVAQLFTSGNTEHRIKPELIIRKSVKNYNL